MGFINPPVTLNDRMIASGGIPSGFDYMRILLACLVVFYHSFETSYGAPNAELVYASWWRALAASVLPMFFALSGFLVAGSMERTSNVYTFTALRVLRIFPALSVELILSALVLGPLLTAVTLHEYFTHPDFFVYFENLIGNVHYRLPGLFPNNPVPGIVNAQLWTLPFELYSYMLFIIVALLGVYQRPYLFLPFLGLWFVLVNYLVLFAGYDMHLRPITVMGHTLMMASFSGALLFRLRKIIPWNAGLFALCAVLSWLALSHPFYDVLAPLPLAYVTVYLGVMNPPRDKIVLSGDYSYGIFLYGYPLQQGFAIIGPAVHTWWLNLFVVLPVTILVAAGSWWLVEKPTLRLRRYLPGYQPLK